MKTTKFIFASLLFLGAMMFMSSVTLCACTAFDEAGTETGVSREDSLWHEMSLTCDTLCEIGQGMIADMQANCPYLLDSVPKVTLERAMAEDATVDEVADVIDIANENEMFGDTVAESDAWLDWLDLMARRDRLMAEICNLPKYQHE